MEKAYKMDNWNVWKHSQVVTFFCPSVGNRSNKKKAANI
jgi:hypothetical protein